MSSLRAKITLLTVIAILIPLTFAALFGVITIRNLGNADSEQILLLLCETGQKNLNYYTSHQTHNQYVKGLQVKLFLVQSYMKQDFLSH